MSGGRLRVAVNSFVRLSYSARDVAFTTSLEVSIATQTVGPAPNRLAFLCRPN